MPPEHRQLLGPQDPSISFDLECATCGYNLRGLALDAACPECNTPASDSIKGRRLRDLGLEYVSTLARGSRLLVLTVRAFVALLLAFVGFLVLAAILRNTWPPIAAPLAYGEYIALAVLVLLFASWARAWWLMTVPEPIEPEHRRAENARLISRISAIVLAASVASAAANEIIEAITGQRRAIDIADHIVQYAILLSLGAHALSFFVYAGALAVRLAERALARRAQQLLWLALIVGAWQGVHVIGLPPFPGSRIVDAIHSLLFLVLLIMTAGLAERLAGSVRAEATLAPPDLP